MSDLYGKGPAGGALSKGLDAKIGTDGGQIINEVIAAAVKENLFTHQAPELFALLAQLDWGEKIPDEVFQTVVELVAWILEVDTQFREDRPKSPSG
ncbi:hypothetical protein [Microbulbifer sp. ARAS458-1]|uniref:hypothetical protein n=1 Tax=Microbulbifer sp. ARAS458-1 TaxID=3140242 RepID=UPI00387802FE